MYRLMLSTWFFATLLDAQNLSFAPIGFPSTSEQKHAIVATHEMRVNDQAYAIGYHIIARSGEHIGQGVFGAILDQDDKPLFISDKNDFSSLHYRFGNYFMITQFESIPAAIYLTKLTRDSDGNFQAVDTRNIDMQDVGGLWVPCAGSVTPWGSHLSSEEYEPDASEFSTDASMQRYFGAASSSMNLYNYGWIPEVTTLRYGKIFS
jgi:secreted PhoX family phosphatase